MSKWDFERDINSDGKEPENPSPAPHNEFDDNVNSNEGGTFDLNSFSTVSENEDSDSKGPQKKGKKSHEKLDAAARRQKILKNVLFVSLIGIIAVCIVIGLFLGWAFIIVGDNQLDHIDLNHLEVYLEEQSKNDLADGKVDFALSTVIYVVDKETGQYVPYKSLSGAQNRIWVDYYDMPKYLGDAFVAIEDERFFTHTGVDLKRTFLAFVNMVVNYSDSEFGGSTITQQLVKNLTRNDDHTIKRKVQEILCARKLESQYDKDTILGCYLNTVYMGKGAYGVECAANYYFNKSVDELTIAESAVLASIVKGPTYYNPVDNYESNKARKETVLYKMHQLGRITDEEYKAALEEEITIIAEDGTTASSQVNSYFVDALIEEVAADMVEQGKFDSKDAAVSALYTNGYKIYCTMDPDVQAAVEEVYSDETKRLENKETGEKAQGAITIMDYQGRVVGIAGGLGEKKESRGLNRATSSPRQLGSAMKPLTAYALAIENNIRLEDGTQITYSSIVDDKKTVYPSGGKDWTPNNWYKNPSFLGKITVATAIERSTNTIPVQIVNCLPHKGQTSYDFLTKKLGFTHLTSEDVNLSPMGMGGTNGGVTTLEAAAAYAMFGNGGVYYEPIFYTLVTDQQDNTVLRKKSNITVAIGEDTACIMNHLLQCVIYGSKGTGRDVVKNYMPKHRIFAKTGTSNEDKDAWFVGGTTHYIGASWYGYDIPATLSDTTLARDLWGAVMQKIHKDLPVENFEDSKYVESRYYCTETGKLATDACEKVAVGWYKTSYRETCDVHEGTIREAIVEKKEDADGTSSGTASGSTSSGQATTSSAQ